MTITGIFPFFLVLSRHRRVSGIAARGPRVPPRAISTALILSLAALHYLHLSPAHEVVNPEPRDRAGVARIRPRSPLIQYTGVQQQVGSVILLQRWSPGTADNYHSSRRRSKKISSLLSNERADLSQVSTTRAFLIMTGLKHSQILQMTLRWGLGEIQ